MRITDSERRQYIKEIKALLVCDKDQQAKFLENFNSDIDDYLSDNPEAGLDELKRDFGTPQEIADEFLAHSSAKEIKKRMSGSKVLVAVVLGIMILVFAVYLSAMLIEAKIDKNAHFEDTIIVHDVVYESSTAANENVQN